MSKQYITNTATRHKSAGNYTEYSSKYQTVFPNTVGRQGEDKS